jgi:hypothetical protein
VDVEDLSQEADELLASAATDQAEADKATKIRKTEKRDFEATNTDFSESIDAIERAISVLQSRQADVPQSFLQMVRSAKLLPVETKKSIEGLLALKSALNTDGTPKANAYEFQSGGVVDMLKSLRLKFQDQRVGIQKAESAAKANYEVIMQRLTTSIKTAKDIAAKKTAAKGQRLEDAATAKGDLSVTEKSKMEDEKKLDLTSSQCDARAKEFDSNQATRADEIKAIQEAAAILNDGVVTGTAASYLPASFLQSKTSIVSLAQTRGFVSLNARARATQLLQSRARELGSRSLLLAASYAAADPFGKVKRMVKDLIVKLMEEANSEADHQAHCKTEMATNKQTRENKQAEVEDLMANVEKVTADSQQLAQELADLNRAVADISKEQAEATKLRGEEKNSNANTVEDAKKAQIAVERATRVLKDFYGKAADSAFLQASFKARLAQVSREPYTGMQTEHGNVLGFLEVVLSDFARLEAETATAEELAQESFEQFVAETNEDLAVKRTEIGHKENAKVESDDAASNFKKELDLTREELDAAVKYYENLKTDCVNNGMSYEERVEKREAEVQSLQEALQILATQDLS